ncbi:MAG: amidohydrolase [Bryobacterales bacterium]|nr:amidohydrolase [Bryobacterales bacterium]
MIVPSQARCLASVLTILLIGCSTQPAPQQATKTEGQNTPKKPQELKYGIDVQPGPMDSILLKDYAPASSLVVPETKVPKPKYPAIDVHTHSYMSNVKAAEDVDRWLKVMDEVGLEKSVVFTGATGPEFDRQAELFAKYPQRFQVWCSIDTKDIDAPDYPQRAAAEIERCYRKGARGIGELSDKGFGLGGSEKKALPRDKRLHIDDPRLDLVWKKIAELKIPANIHIADHPSCWKPLGPNQERTPDFQHFNMTGKDVPSYEELLASRDRLVAKHPATTFIFCHLSNQGNDTATLAKFLDAHKNVYLDFSARDYELGRQPRTARKFMDKYKDRLMFGTDMGSEAHMYQGWWRLLETGDEFIPGRQWWRYYGLELPASTLEAVYRGTALKVLAR